MKKLVLLFMLSISMGTLIACGNGGFDESSSINVYTRDTSSGTRAGFMNGIGFDAAVTDDSVLVSGFSINDNAGIMNAMTTDVSGIGYISISSLNDTIKPLNFNGIEPSMDNVIDDTYDLKRPFNYILRLEEDYDSETKYQIARALETFILTPEGVDAINDAGAIGLEVDNSASLDNHSVCQQDNGSITFNVGGSNSVTRVAKSLTDAFGPRCGDIDFVHNHTGSSDAFKRTQDDEKDSVNALDFGFASRDFYSEEMVNDEKYYGQAAWDAIVIIVHNDNPLDNLEHETVKAIYNGEIMTWEDIE